MQREIFVSLRKRTEIGVAVVTILVIILFSATTNGVWLSSANMREVLRVTSILSIVAFGEALVITTREIDISVGSIFGMVGITYLALTAQIGVPLAILVALAAGLAIGAVNGFVVSYFRMPSLVVTLGGLFVFRGLAIAATEKSFYFAADSQMRANPVYKLFGNSDVLGVNNALVWAILVMLFLNYVLFLTPVGNRILAVGGDDESARSRGVSILYTKWGVFIASGFLAGLAGILQAGNLGYADGGFGRQMELQAIAAAVLGGCALAGGRSSIFGTFLGAFILSCTESYLVINGVQPHWYVLLLGLIVVLVSLADRGLTHLVYRVGEAETT